ncbi:MAG: serine protease [Candidatus Cryptobacteroides sp.]
MKNVFLFVCMSTIMVQAFCGCDNSQRITGTRDKVMSVNDGKTIKLQSGLTVELIGVKASEMGRKYLETQVKGKSVTLVADKLDPIQTYKTNQTKVRAYVRVPGERISLNGKLLVEKWANGVDTKYLKDSAKVYGSYWQKSNSDVLLTEPELLLKIKPATFLIMTDNGSGTGFYIGSNGLALTNNHVFNADNTQAQVVPFGEDGQLMLQNAKPVCSILFTIRKGCVDFTIFKVALDADEKVSFINLANKHANPGEKLAKLGCPSMNVCNFQSGNLSNYIAGEGYFVHSVPSSNGDSGGPVVDYYGRVVGINQSIAANQTLSQQNGEFVQAPGVAYAVDIQLVKELMDEMQISYGR